jgi:hypothetical protein
MLKIIKPSDFERKAQPGEIFIRVDFNTVSLSRQFCIELKSQKGDPLGFAQNGDDVLLYKAGNEKEGFVLRGVVEKGLQFSHAGFVGWLLKHYGLFDLLKTSEAFKCHRFPLIKTIVEGKEYWMLEPPKKYEPENKTNGALKAELV